jgi:hypothetical protein
MVNLIRRFQQPLMVAITVLVIIAFTWFYSRNDFLDKMGADKVGLIYGRTITMAQAQRVGRKFEICQELAMRNMFQGLPVELLQGLAQRQQGAKENFIWNNMVLRHEAERLGLAPSEEEIFNATQALPAFQTNGQYDSGKYSAFIQGTVTPRGFSADDLGELIGDCLRLKKVQTLLGSTAAPTEGELRDTYARFAQKIEASVVKLKLDDFLATAQVPEEDVKKSYEERKGTLKSDELRKVKFVAFILPTTDEPLDGKSRAEALGKLGKQAEDFSIAMTEKDAKLDEAAAKFEAKVEETPEFSRAEPPAALGESGAAVTAAFKLTEKQPNSDVITTDRGYFVLQLAGVTPPRQLTFDESKERLAAELKRDRAQEALNLKATEIRNKIDAELKAGKSFADAVQAAGAKAEKFPTFSRQEPKMEAENSGEIMSTAAELNAGQLSSVVPTPDGAVIVHVDQRPPIDDEKYKTEKTRVASGLEELQKSMLFTEWLKLRRNAAQLQLNLRG